MPAEARKAGRARIAISAVLVLGATAGCSSGGTPKSVASSRPPVSARPSALPPCASHLALPAVPSGPTSSVPLWTVAAGLDQPDDLLVHDGALLIGVLGTGRIKRLIPGLPLSTLPVQIPRVEGLAYVGDTLYAAGQAQDRVYAIRGDRASTLIQLSPVPGQDGVDGIGVQGGLLIVPDSPRGAVDWVDPASGRIVRSLGGFTRPTGVWPEADGSLLIADEFGNAAFKIAPDGTRTALVRGLPIVDDVAADPAGNVFVVTPVISGGRLAQLVNGRAVDLVSGLAAPQGLAVDDAGNLYVSESSANRVDLAIRSFKLVPLGTVTDSALQPDCIDLVRGPGFETPVHLSAGAGISIVKQPGTGDQGAILVTGCRIAPCQLTADAGGGRTDSLWIEGHS